MKKKIDRYSAVAVCFICFIFTILAGTVAKVYVSRNEYINEYSVKLGENTGYAAKTKAMALTVYDTLKNIDGKIYKRTEFINIYGLAQKPTGNRYVYDSSGASGNVVKLDNGMLSFVLPKSNDLAKKAEKTALLDAHLKSKCIDLLYVQLPFKINKRDNKLPPGVVDYSNKNSDAMLTELRSRGVSTFDLREEIVGAGLDHYSLFFRTDHHWKPETGLWAAGKIAEILNSEYGFKIDITLLNKNNFSTKAYKNWFLGSQGKRVGQLYAGTDDFTLLLPKYKTDMSGIYTRISGEDITKKGSFQDAWLFMDSLKRIDYFNLNTYVTYSGGDYPLTVCTNNLLAGKKILLLRDSYTCALAPFISLAACKELRTIDPRHFKGSIAGYIDDFKPDIVLMLYYPTALSNSMFFDF